MKRTKPKAGRRSRAATADVLGAVLRPDRVPQKWRKHYRSLIEVRERMLNRQGNLVKDAADEQPGFSLHMADAGTDSYDRDLALSRISSEQDAVYEIDEALNRIRNGTYGICEATGKPIEPKRLEIIPWTRFCKAAEKDLEKTGSLPHTRLAPSEHVARSGNTHDEDSESGEDEQE